jgi:hypothetical protein
LTSKTAVLEDIRSEKRILQAEREDVIRRLMSIQQDLEEIAAMETKITLETGKFENELNQRFQDEQYVKTRRIFLVVRNSSQRKWPNSGQNMIFRNWLPLPEPEKRKVPDISKVV